MKTRVTLIALAVMYSLSITSSASAAGPDASILVGLVTAPGIGPQGSGAGTHGPGSSGDGGEAEPTGSEGEGAAGPPAGELDPEEAAGTLEEPIEDQESGEIFGWPQEERP